MSGSFAGCGNGTVFHGFVRYKAYAAQSIQAQYGHNPVYATVPQGVCKGCAQKQLKAVYLEQCAVEVYDGYSLFWLTVGRPWEAYEGKIIVQREIGQYHRPACGDGDNGSEDIGCG